MATATPCHKHDTAWPCATDCAWFYQFHARNRPAWNHYYRPRQWWISRCRRIFGPYPGHRAVIVHDNNRTIANILRINHVCHSDVVINFARYAIKRGWKSIHVSDNRHYTCMDSRETKNEIIVGNAAMNHEKYSETIICGRAWLYQPYQKCDDR